MPSSPPEEERRRRLSFYGHRITRCRFDGGDPIRGSHSSSLPFSGSLPLAVGEYKILRHHHAPAARQRKPPPPPPDLLSSRSPRRAAVPPQPHGARRRGAPRVRQDGLRVRAPPRGFTPARLELSPDGIFSLCARAGASTTGGGAGSARPAAATSSTAAIATTSPRCRPPPHLPSPSVSCSSASSIHERRLRR